MITVQAIQQSLSASVAADGAIIFPTLLVDKSRERWFGRNSADQALAYYRSFGMCGERSTKNEYGYGKVFRSLTKEPPPWVNPIEMDEMDDMSPERESQLRPLTMHVQETSDEILFERFCQWQLERNTFVRSMHLGLDLPSDEQPNDLAMSIELDEFKNLVSIARLLGPDLAFDLGRCLLYEFGDDSSGLDVGTGAPDLFLWASNGDESFWFFSEVKACGDYLSMSQKNWLTQHWPLVQGHFLLTILG